MTRLEAGAILETRIIVVPAVCLNEFVPLGEVISTGVGPGTGALGSSDSFSARPLAAASTAVPELALPSIFCQPRQVNKPTSTRQTDPDDFDIVPPSTRLPTSNHASLAFCVHQLLLLVLLLVPLPASLFSRR